MLLQRGLQLSIGKGLSSLLLQVHHIDCAKELPQKRLGRLVGSLSLESDNSNGMQGGILALIYDLQQHTKAAGSFWAVRQ